MVQSPRASVPTESVLKTPYTQSRGALLRAGKNVLLCRRTRGREETVLMQETSGMGLPWLSTQPSALSALLGL